MEPPPPRLRAVVLCCALINGVGCGVDPEAEGPPPGIDSIQQSLSSISCGNSTATGYVQGKAFTIVVVKVDGKPVQVDTANAYYVMAKAAAAKGVNIKVVSGFRTNAEQQYLYNCYKSCSCNSCNLAASPGFSNHQSGHALDLNTGAAGVLSWLNNNGGKYGFKRTVAGESWHWEWWGGGPGGGPCGGGDKAFYGVSCLADAGSCQSRKNYNCASGDWRSGLCPGGADVQCCTFFGVSCAAGAGTCRSRTSYSCASGDWRSGLCPGGTDVKCCIAQVEPPVVDKPRFPQLSITAAAVTDPDQDADTCKLGASEGIDDLFVNESAEVVVDVRNTGSAKAANTQVAIAVAAAHLELRSWRILRKSGDAFEVDETDAQQQIPRDAAGGAFDLNLGTIAPDASKRVELTVVATAPSFGGVGSGVWSPIDIAADDQPGGEAMSVATDVDGSAGTDADTPSDAVEHPTVHAWVAHVDDYYDKLDYSAKPDNIEGYQKQNGGDLKASYELDVLGPEIRNHLDDDCDGLVDEQVDGEQFGPVGRIEGGCAVTPSPGRPAWPWLLALLGLLVRQRRRALDP